MRITNPLEKFHENKKSIRSIFAHGRKVVLGVTRGSTKTDGEGKERKGRFVNRFA